MTSILRMPNHNLFKLTSIQNHRCLIFHISDCNTSFILCLIRCVLVNKAWNLIRKRVFFRINAINGINHLNAIIFKLGGVHEGCLGNLEMPLWDKNAYGVCIVVVTDGQAQFGHRKEIETNGLNGPPLQLISELELEAIVRFVVQVEIGTHDGERMQLAIKVATHPFVFVHHLQIAHQYDGLVVNRGTSIDVVQIPDGGLQRIVNR